MRIKFGAPIINLNWSRGFFSCSGRVSFYAPKIRCANKLARYKYEGLVWSASLVVKQIAYSFCWRERKRKYISQWQTARSKQKWTSIATVPDLCPTTVKLLTHLISRYHLPLKFYFTPITGCAFFVFWKRLILCTLVDSPFENEINSTKNSRAFDGKSSQSN